MKLDIPKRHSELVQILATDILASDLHQKCCAKASLLAHKCARNAIYDGVVWRAMPGASDPDLSPYRAVRTIARTRRFGGVAGFTGSSRYWRVVVYNATALGAISLGGLRFWKETGLSKVKHFNFARVSDEGFQVILTDYNLDVFRGGVYCASVAVPIPTELVREVHSEQSLDTLFLFHEDVATQQVVRQGAADEWNPGVFTFANMPNLSSNTAFSGTQDERQRIDISGLIAGASFYLVMGNTITAAIPFTTAAALPALIAAAITALPNVSADAVKVDLISTVPLSLRVSFINGNGSRR